MPNTATIRNGIAPFLTKTIFMFDEKTIQHLKYYVYMLIDPADNKPFYIGKGVQNRVIAALTYPT